MAWWTRMDSISKEGVEMFGVSALVFFAMFVVPPLVKKFWR